MGWGSWQERLLSRAAGRLHTFAEPCFFVVGCRAEAVGERVIESSLPAAAARRYFKGEGNLFFWTKQSKTI
jgi:hypothetical protein